jgi:hypothetical protein
VTSVNELRVGRVEVSVKRAQLRKSDNIAIIWPIRVRSTGSAHREAVATTLRSASETERTDEPTITAGVADGTRTRNSRNHNPGLYH